jgi:predicted TIM-barrel fold metal-dependent hydrolase
MKIINAHAHLIELEMVLQDQAKYLGLLQSIPSFTHIEETMRLLSVDAVLQQMQEAGIDKSILFACYAPILYASNDFVAKICKKFPDKLIGFASVNPKEKNAPQALENAINNLGLRGLKLHPPLQDFYPNSKEMWPIYEKAQALHIPVVFHVGSTPFGSLVKLSQADPLLIDEVAIAFPKLNIILTHLGTLWHNETFMVVEKNPNVYLDTAAYPYEIKELLTCNMVERIGEKKLIFGTDFPMPYEKKVHQMKDHVEAIRSLEISDEVKENIFHKNLERILGIL